MNMYIGENIKRLRKEKSITQEKLAEHLNISCQAVSKWERGETYPDITLIIPLASYFGVSTDDLLGVDHARNEQKIREHLGEFDRLSYLGKEKEKFDLICAAYEEFPNDFRIIEKYMWMLAYDPHCEFNEKTARGVPAHVDELSRLCGRVLDECTIDTVRYSALEILGDVYRLQGMPEKALELNERFPGCYNSRGEMYEQSYERGSAEWWHWIRHNINDLSESIVVKFRNCALYSKSAPEERIKQFFKAVDYIKLLFEDGDYGFAHYHLCELYIWISNRYIELNDWEKAAEYLDLGLSHAVQYDGLPETTVHTSFLMRGYEFDSRKVYSGFEGNNVMRELDYIDKSDFYDKAREMDCFKSVLDKYRPYAKSGKK